MAKISSKWLALLGGVALGAASLAHAQDSGPLIDALVKKGILNDQEAEEIRADLIKDFGTSSAGKLNLSSALTELKLSGDARVRYEYRTGEDNGANEQEKNRYRYRLRLALSGKFHDGWFFGTRIEPLANNRSTNVTAGNATTPFSKADSLAIGQAYIGRNWDDFTVTAGRMPNPLVSTSMVWDDDINPDGLAEQWSHEAGKITWMANFAQFVYEGTGTTNPINNTTTSRENTYLWAFQVGGKAKVAEGVSVQVMPTYYRYSGNDTSATALNAGLGTGINSYRTEGLEILDLPVEIGFKIGALPAKVFGDFAYNLDADTRAREAGKPGFTGEDTAYMVGFGIGQSKVKGDWEAKAFWQSVDAFALDSNLVDSDLFDGRTNMEGFGLQGTYVITDGVSVKFTYANADRKNNSLATYGAGDIGSANLKHYQLFQADLSVKF
jgi:hypothetical protein